MAAKRGYTYPAPSSAQFNQQKILTDSQENGVKAIPVTDFAKSQYEIQQAESESDLVDVEIVDKKIKIKDKSTNIKLKTNSIQITPFGYKNCTITTSNYNKVNQINHALEKGKKYVIKFFDNTANFSRFRILSPSYSAASAYIEYSDGYIVFTCTASINTIGIVIYAEDMVSAGSFTYAVYDYDLLLDSVSIAKSDDVQSIKNIVYKSLKEDVSVYSVKPGCYTSSGTFNHQTSPFNDNYETWFFPASSLNQEKFVIDGSQFGTGYKRYSFVTSDDCEDSSFISGVNASSTTSSAVPFSYELNTSSVPSNAVYIAVTRRLKNPSLYASVSNIVLVPYPAYNEEEINKIKGSFKYGLKKYGDRISVIQRYSNTEDLILEFYPNGPNSIMTIDKQKFVARSENLSFDSTVNKTYSTNTDWVCAMKLNVSNNADGDGSSSTGFVGGWHGCNGNQSGLATARMVSYRLYIDKKSIEENGVYYGNNIEIYVTNRLQASNTIKSDGSGREAVEQNTSYVFCDGKLHITNRITPLEDVSVTYMLGLTVAGYSAKYEVIGEKKSYVSNSSGVVNGSNKGDSQHDAICTDSSGRKIVMHAGFMNTGSGIYCPDKNLYAMSFDYGKIYFYNIPEYSNVYLSAGSSIFWDGSLEWMKDESF